MPSPMVEHSRDGAVSRITLQRPEKLNALSGQMLTELDGHLRDLEADEEVRAVVVEGAGDRAFSVGADVAELRRQRPAQVTESNLAGHAVFDRLERLPVPTVALLHGHVLGGGLELALCCDVRLAARSARLGLPEVSLGVLPGWGGTWRLALAVGHARARELVLTGRVLDAEDAAGKGLVHELVDDGRLRARGDEVAEEIAANSPDAVRLAKRTMLAGQPVQPALRHTESAAVAALVDTEEFARRFEQRFGSR